MKWVEDRMENLLACGHAHEQAVEAALAARKDGRVLGIRGQSIGGPRRPYPWPNVGGPRANDHRAVHRWPLPHR